MIFVDAHVHLHNCFDIGIFLTQAYRNFLSAAKDQPLVIQGILLFADDKENRSRDRIVHYVDGNDSWHVMESGEPVSIWVHQKGSKLSICLIDGRQFVTREGIEVLGLLTDMKFRNRMPLVETIDAISEGKGLVVLPWGFGKWIGRRGAIVSEFIKKKSNKSIFLGDNGGRPSFLSEPKIFKIGRRHRYRVLPGSDPLAVSGETSRVGGYGFASSRKISIEMPAKDLGKIIADTASPIEIYGERVDALTFLINQIRIRTISAHRLSKKETGR